MPKQSTHPGFSIREHLLRQGVTDEKAMKEHISFIARTLSVNPNLDITRYKVAKDDPNKGPHHG